MNATRIAIAVLLVLAALLVVQNVRLREQVSALQSDLARAQVRTDSLPMDGEEPPRRDRERDRERRPDRRAQDTAAPPEPPGPSEPARAEPDPEQRAAERLARAEERRATVFTMIEGYAEDANLSAEVEEELMLLMEDSLADRQAILDQGRDGELARDELRDEMRALREDVSAELTALIGAEDAEALIEEMRQSAPSAPGGGPGGGGGGPGGRPGEPGGAPER